MAACRLEIMSKSSDANLGFQKTAVSSHSHQDYVYPSDRIPYTHFHTCRYDMVQSAGFSKNPLNNNPFWEKASAEPPLEWSKWAAIFEMAALSKDRIEERNLQRN